MNQKKAGFREIEHTADWELLIWAPDLPALLEQAARGMYALAQTQLRETPRVKRTVQVEAPDWETLLVDFLTELLFFGEDENLGFDEFELTLAEGKLEAQIGGAPIESQAKEVKAITYHNLKIRQTERGVETNIVLDV